MWVGGQRHSPAALTPKKDSVPLFIGSWVDPRVGLEGCRKFRPHRDSHPGQSSP